MQSDDASEPRRIPASYLLHARALAAWGNSVGMTPTQRDIHLYVASMLATNPECWISVSRLAKEIGRTTRGCRKAMSAGKSLFDHDGYDKNADPDTRRFWRLVLPMPSKAGLAPFLPKKKGSLVLDKPDLKPTETPEQNSCSSRNEVPIPPRNEVPQSINTSPTVRCLEDNHGVNRSSGGGGADHHHQKEQHRKELLREWLWDKDIPLDAKDYPRRTAIQILSAYHQEAQRRVAAAVDVTGITEGSPEWRHLFPSDGSVVYKPSDADLDYLIPLVEIARDNGQCATKEAARNMPGWILQQIKLAIHSRTPFRQCLRMSAFSSYLSGFEVFQRNDELPPEVAPDVALT